MAEIAVGFIGASPAIREVLEDADAIAASDSKVLISGESGVGKEVLARLIHARSRRRQRPMLTINCAGVPEGLLESEFFGHVRGSFTGADRDRQGFLEAADTGTVLLDEVGEMSLRMQGMLLRFLESGEIQRIGSERARTTVDVRIIAATNRDLLEQVQAREFREDLYYRLNIVYLVVPPLRERREDIALLFQHYIELLSAQMAVPRPEIGPGVMETLEQHDWPGNVRELRNVVERLLLMRPGQLITPEKLPITPRRACPGAGRERPDAREDRRNVLPQHGGRGRLVLDGGLRAVHGPRPYARDGAPHHPAEPAEDQGQLPDDRATAEPAAGRLQAIHELPPEARLRDPVSGLPGDQRGARSSPATCSSSTSRSAALTPDAALTSFAP